MKKFVEAKVRVDEKQIQSLKEHWKKSIPTMTEKEMDDAILLELKGKTFINDVYQVTIHEAEVPKEFPEMFWLSIKRLDREPIRDWRDMQTIKNELVGTENEGVEIYPAESRLVDSANQYHMWVLKDSSIQFPFGMRGARLVTDVQPENTNIKQRSFNEKTTK